MNASEMTFGIEIETTMPLGSVELGSHGAGRQVAWMPEGWKADRDPSIHYGRNRMPCEFVSPVLSGAAGIQQLIAALNAIRQHGGKVNASGGIHIHVGFGNRSSAELQRLVTLVANFERAIFASTGTKARERGRWCGSIQRHGEFQAANRAASQYRYHVLNLNNLACGRRPTVEFRAFSASLNVIKVLGYVRLCLGLVERALKSKRVAPWVAKTPVESSPIHRSGEGQTALTRLFYQLGWTKGRTDYRYGWFDVEGSPAVEKTKRELMRLAKKYDQT